MLGNIGMINNITIIYNINMINTFYHTKLWGTVDAKKFGHLSLCR